jgi:hypothetical protein
MVAEEGEHPSGAEARTLSLLRVGLAEAMPLLQSTPVLSNRLLFPLTDFRQLMRAGLPFDRFSVNCCGRLFALTNFC